MLVGSIPVKTSVVWAQSAGGAYIRTVPIPSQIGVQDGAASYTDGFPPDCFTPTSGGGVPPFGQDMNGALNEVTAWLQWMEAGAPVFYDSAFSTAVGGYPKGSRLPSAILPGLTWLSTADSNTTDPDSSSAANWIQDPGQVQTGTPMPCLTATAIPGYVPANTNTIGNASSNGTNRANADTLFLFRFLWSLPASVCPIFTSGGAPSTRGATATADFAANKAIATPDMRGAGLVGVDTMGGPATTRLSGVPVTSGSATVPGSIIGENFHVLTSTEVPATAFATNTGVESVPHTHQYNATPTASPVGGGYSGTGNIANPIVVTNTGGESVTHTHSVTGAISGGGGSHNNVPLDNAVYWNLKL